MSQRALEQIQHPVQQLSLPPYSSTSPTTNQDLPSLLHTQISTHCWCRPFTHFPDLFSPLQGRERQYRSQGLHKKCILKRREHVLHLQSLHLFQVNTLNSDSQTRSLYSIVWLPAFPKAFNRSEGTGIA